jgi:TolB-like protein/Tfp pilus assembly protein PilF/tRNA A-37 threonylcarbamoyl transferase component Bud32
VADAPSILGRTFSHYRIVEIIGAGGMGVVYRAHDERLDRDVALKFLPAGALGDENARKQFRSEALILAKLNHPNIATIFEFVSQDGIEFLVMEFLSGKSLAQERAGEAWPEKQLIAVASQIAQALQEAHERGVIHRDLKPGNIMITAKGLAKVLDFGLAGHWAPVSEKTTTDGHVEPRIVQGTLPYMAPEQLLGEGMDARTDVYGLGVLMYEMGTSLRPFRDAVSARLTDNILHQIPAPLHTLNKRISPELERIILKCLEKDPENRYQSAKELDVDLRRLQMPSSSGVVVDSPGTATFRRWHVALVCLIAAAVTIAWAVYARHKIKANSGSGPIQSLAVLPLENLSGDAEQQYFADGMTEELITQLAQISALRVISRTSVMPYVGSRKPLAEIAKELRVDAVVEGSVMRSGDRVRINAKLIRGSTDKSLWAKEYERNLTDVLGMQSEVARDIAQEIRVEITPQEQARLASNVHVSADAHDAYLKGRYHWNRETEEQYKQAEKYFEQAIAIDPNYAPGYAGLADYYWSTDDLAPQIAMPKAKAFALKALAIDDTLSTAHTTLADVKFYADWDWPGAEMEYKRAIALNSNDAEAHRMYSVFLSAMGRHDEALAEMRTAQSLDPVSIFTSSSAGWTFYFARQFDRAIDQCQKALELEPGNVGAHSCLGYSYMAKGNYSKAVTECKKAVDLSKNDPLQLEGLGLAYGLAGKKAEARQTLAELDARSKDHYVPPYFLATVNVGLDRKAEALALLEKGYGDRDPYLPWLKVEPALDPLRSNPRFQELLQRIALPQ